MNRIQARCQIKINYHGMLLHDQNMNFQSGKVHCSANTQKLSRSLKAKVQANNLEINQVGTCEGFNHIRTHILILNQIDSPKLGCYL